MQKSQGENNGFEIDSKADIDRSLAPIMLAIGILTRPTIDKCVARSSP